MSLVDGPIFQVAWVVDDIDASERWFTETLGIPSFHRFSDVHFGPNLCRYRGEPADFVIEVGIGYAGDQQVELIQPVSGRNIYVEYLERSGPGLHHIAFVPEDFDAALAEGAARGMAVTQEGSFAGGAMRFAYLDGSAGGSPNIELIHMSPQMATFFDMLKQ
ncbi:MAG TPA: VOC family protein [Actinomycetota bacterium]|nr:VOC family protein [Actinomycetota bacterium]